MAASTAPYLFPIVPPHRDTGLPSPTPPEAAERTGIARLASSSPLADAKRGAEYFLLPTRSILNHCDSERVPFRWTINPYRGCEFGCQYCYARYTHEYMDLDGSGFRAQDLREARRRPAGGARPAVARGARRAYRHRDGHRPLPARGTRVRRHARDPRADGQPRRIERFDHHQVQSGAEGRGFAAAHRGTLDAACESDSDHAPGASGAGSSSRARRAPICG